MDTEYIDHVVILKVFEIKATNTTIWLSGSGH